MAQQLTNFVKTTLNTTITDVATSIIVDAASSPWSTPPDPAGNTQTITLTDDLNNPTKFEIVTYTGRTGAGPYTLTGCTRGAEGTTAQAWTAGAVIVGEATAGTIKTADAAGGSAFFADDGTSPTTAPVAAGVDSIAMGIGGYAGGQNAVGSGTGVTSGAYGALGTYSHCHGFYCKAANLADMVFSYQSQTGGSGSRQSIFGGFSNSAAASGQYNSILGGTYDVISGAAWWSTIVGGAYNQINGSAHAAMAFGYEGKAIDNLQMVHGGGKFAAVGDCQASQRVLRASTTTATQTTMAAYADGTGATYITIPSDSTVMFTINIVARRTDVDGESASYVLEGCIDNNAGTTALVGTVTQTVVAEDTAAWDVTAVANDTTDTLDIKVTGEAGKTIRWVAFVRTVEVTG